MADYTLTAKIVGDSSKFSKEFDKAQEKLKGFDKSVESMSGKLVSGGKDMMKFGAKTTAMTAPIVMMGKQVFQTGMEFEESMSNVAAITRATDDDMAAMTEQARELGGTTRYSAKEASEAMGFLGMSGMKTDEIMAAIPETLNFATAAGIELGRSAEIVSGNLNAFGLEAEDAQRVTDVFAEAQASSAQDADQLASALEKVAPMAASMGHEVEGTSALLAVLADRQIKGSRAGTMLNRVYAEMSELGQEGAVAIGEHSIEIYNAQGEMRNMTDIISDMSDATEGMTDKQIQNALSTQFNGQAIDALIPLMSAGSEEILGMEEALYNSEGAADRMAETMDDNLGGAVAGMSSSFDELKLTLFDASEGAFNVIIEKVTNLIDWFAGLDESTISTIAAIAGIAVVIPPIIIAIGALITSVGTIMGALKKLSFIMNPATLGFAAVIAAGVLLYKNWDTIKEKAAQLRDWLSGIWDNIKDKVSTVWNGITDFLSNTWDKISNVFNFALELIKAIVEGAFTIITTIIRVPMEIIKALFTTIWNYIGDFTMETWDKIKDVIGTVTDAIQNIVSTAWNGIKSVVTTVTGAIRSVITTIWNSIKKVTSTVWNAIKSAISKPFNAARDLVSGIVDGMSSKLSGTFDSIRDTASRVWNRVKEAITSPIESARDTISGILDTIKGFFSKLRLRFPKIEMPKLPRFSLDGKFSLNPPSVPRLRVNWHAKGAIFTRPTIFGNHGVGEAGAEAVLPIEKLGGIMADTLDRMGYSNEADNRNLGTDVYVTVTDAEIYDTRDIKDISKDLGTQIKREVEFG